jgi:hypothetical protein
VAEAVYVLCFLTSAAVAFLLLRAWARMRRRILLWSGLGFVFLCLNNLMLVIDLVIIPEHDLALVRHLLALIGAALLVFGMVWDGD